MMRTAVTTIGAAAIVGAVYIATVAPTPTEPRYKVVLRQNVKTNAPTTGVQISSNLQDWVEIAAWPKRATNYFATVTFTSTAPWFARSFVR